ncbi:uncharacterized protein J3D65DRAFT_124626 [Phyllosticta citribraziliensis]|uniref:Uncharacterized protein n=1 Tax=Phyllosticta citribraziliensis TaxID=989973 RepID=A0ABR1L903_9PEZI
MALPMLSSTPRHHPDCCLSLSATFLSKLDVLLPAHGCLALSIGSGSGFFEAQLQAHDPALHVEGVEVNSSINKYLPEEATWEVGGTWDICPRAKAAQAWIFVYPREPGLIKRYFDAHADGEVTVVVWLGPRLDWEDFQDCFKFPAFAPVEIIEDCGLAPYEMMAVTRRKVE